MISERNAQRLRAAQLGFFMRAYRESFVDEGGRRGLTQDELLHRMAQVNPEYVDRHSHATVSRWETGSTRVTASRLQTFGGALNLSETEIEGLMLLAGLAPDTVTASSAETAFEVEGDQVEGDVASAGIETAPSSGEPDAGKGPSRDSIPSLLRDAGRFLLSRCAPLGLCIVGLGLVLAIFGQNDAWVPIVYVVVAVGFALVQAVVLPDDNVPLRGFLWVSLFFVLSTPLLQFSPIGMDHYNFHAVGGLYGTPIPFLLALLVNLFLATGAALMFQLLMSRIQFGNGGYPDAFRRAALTALPPVALVYLTVVVISNASVWIQLAGVMPVLGMVYTILLVLRDPSVHPSERDQRMLFPALLSIGIVATVLGVVIIVLVYLTPGVPAVLPDHNLLRSWELDFTQLGYTRAEALDRLNIGYMWHAMFLFAYMVSVVGGTLIVSIYRMNGGDGARSADTRVGGGVSMAEARSTLGRRRRGFAVVGAFALVAKRMRVV